MISSFTSLKCIQWNARGLTHSRLQEFKHFLSTEKPHIVLLSETHWYSWMKKFSFSCYKIARSDRRQRKGGVVAILIHDSIFYVTLSLSPFTSMETVGVTIMSDVGPIDVISVYCPRGDFFQLQVCELFDAPKNEFFIGGDFNAHHRLWEDCEWWQDRIVVAQHWQPHSPNYPTSLCSPRRILAQECAHDCPVLHDRPHFLVGSTVARRGCPTWSSPRE